MRRTLLALSCWIAVLVPASAFPSGHAGPADSRRAVPPEDLSPYIAAREAVEIEGKVAILGTSQGELYVYFYPEATPQHVANFLYLAEEGFYSGVQFHRVIEGFVVQGGEARGDWDEPLPEIVNEASGATTHAIGAIGAARTAELDSATSQFYFALTPLPRLDEMQYTVFGQVFRGLDVLQAIGTAAKNQGDEAAPEKDRIRWVRIVDIGPYEEEVATFKNGVATSE